MIWLEPEKHWNLLKSTLNWKFKITCNLPKLLVDKKLSCKNYMTKKMKRSSKKFFNFMTFTDLKLQLSPPTYCMTISRVIGLWFLIIKIMMLSIKSKIWLLKLKNTLIKLWIRFYTSVNNLTMWMRIKKPYMNNIRWILTYPTLNILLPKDMKMLRELSQLKKYLRLTANKLKRKPKQY